MISSITHRYHLVAGNVFGEEKQNLNQLKGKQMFPGLNRTYEQGPAENMTVAVLKKLSVKR